MSYGSDQENYEEGLDEDEYERGLVDKPTKPNGRISTGDTSKLLRKSSASSLSYKAKKTRALPKESTNVLTQWLYDHRYKTYPCESEKIELSNESHLSLLQVTNWLKNARKRLLPELLLNEGRVPQLYTGSRTTEARPRRYDRFSISDSSSTISLRELSKVPVSFSAVKKMTSSSLTVAGSSSNICAVGGKSHYHHNSDSNSLTDSKVSSTSSTCGRSPSNSSENDVNQYYHKKRRLLQAYAKDCAASKQKLVLDGVSSANSGGDGCSSNNEICLCFTESPDTNHTPRTQTSKVNTNTLSNVLEHSFRQMIPSKECNVNPAVNLIKQDNGNGIPISPDSTRLNIKHTSTSVQPMYPRSTVLERVHNPFDLLVEAAAQIRELELGAVHNPINSLVEAAAHMREFELKQIYARKSFLQNLLESPFRSSNNAS